MKKQQVIYSTNLGTVHCTSCNYPMELTTYRFFGLLSLGYYVKELNEVFRINSSSMECEFCRTINSYGVDAWDIEHKMQELLEKKKQLKKELKHAEAMKLKIKKRMQ